MDQIIAAIATGGSVAEWLTALAALVAVALTIVTLVRARRATQRSDLVRIHERLMSEELQVGRRLLAEAYKSGKPLTRLRDKRPQDWDRINLAVSAFQMLAELVRAKVVRNEDAINLWGGSIRRSWPRFEAYVVARRELDEHPGAWGDLVWFAQECGACVTITESGSLRQ